MFYIFYNFVQWTGSEPAGYRLEIGLK